MKIKYIHSNEPKREKVFDTEQAYKKMQFAINDPDTKLYKKTQIEFDNLYREIFERDKQKGIIKDYKIIAE